MKGVDALTAESKVMSRAMPLCYYNQERYPVKSEAQPGLRKLTLTLGPAGIGWFQNNVKLDTFSWIEIWNAGYSHRTFWFRIIRDGEKSKHKFLVENNRICEQLFKAFRMYFKFYTQEHRIDPKLLWGRVPPQVDRVTLFSEANHQSPFRRMSIAPAVSVDNMENLTSAL